MVYYSILSPPDKQGQQTTYFFAQFGSNFICLPPICMNISSFYQFSYGECPQTSKIDKKKGKDDQKSTKFLNLYTKENTRKQIAKKSKRKKLRITIQQ